MSKKLPKILAAILAVFISIPTLDVFGEGYGLVETIVALLIHLVPTYLILIALLMTRKNETVSGLLFIFFGVLYIVFGRSRSHFDPINYLLISGPCFLIGVLFLLDRRYGH